MTVSELKVFSTEVNGGASIGDTLLYQLLNLAKAMVEQRRPWMLLRSTDTTKTVSAGNTWQTAIDLSTIARFNRFFGSLPIRLFDGVNRTERYRQVPFEDRLEHRDTPNTFCYDESTQTLYLNGTVTFAGFLYIHHIKDTPDIDEDNTWAFPSWSHPLLGFMVNGIYKGGIDFDDVNARMSSDNRGQANAIISMLEAQDSAKQLSAIESYAITKESRSSAPSQRTFTAKISPRLLRNSRRPTLQSFYQSSDTLNHPS